MVAQILQKQIGKIEYTEKKIFWSLFSISAIFIIFYGYFLNSAMMNAVSRQNMEKEITILSSNVNTMEFQYLNLKNSVTLDLAKTKGFVAVSSDKFAVIDSAQKNLSLSINEN